MTEFNALLIGLSRGVDRFNLFTEDMRDQIFVPRSGDLQREGSALGVLDVSALPEGTPVNESTAIGNASRRQMPWVRLWSESERDWKLLQVRNEFARALGKKDWAVAPIFESQVLWSSLQGDAYSACETLVTALSKGPAVAQTLLNFCWGAYDLVPWNYPRPAALG